MNYTTSKLALSGLTNTLAKEGAKDNIHINHVCPISYTTQTASLLPDELQEELHPKYVAPFVAYLCHDDCKESGGIFEVMGGHISKLRWERSEGVQFDYEDFTIENIQKSYD